MIKNWYEILRVNKNIILMKRDNYGKIVQFF